MGAKPPFTVPTPRCRYIYSYLLLAFFSYFLKKIGYAHADNYKSQDTRILNQTSVFSDNTFIK